LLRCTRNTHFSPSDFYAWAEVLSPNLESPIEIVPARNATKFALLQRCGTAPDYLRLGVLRRAWRSAVI
jgi:hypothetical protein